MRLKYGVRYSSIDGCKKVMHYSSIEGARRFAHKMVGPYPSIGRQHQYAVSDDGVGKITIEYGELSLNDLFPGADQ